MRVARYQVLLVTTLPRAAGGSATSLWSSSLSWVIVKEESMDGVMRLSKPSTSPEKHPEAGEVMVWDTWLREALRESNCFCLSEISCLIWVAASVLP